MIQGLFVICAIVLLTVVPTLYIVARRAEHARRSAVADACAAEVDRVLRTNPDGYARITSDLQKKYDLDDISVETAAGSGNNLELRTLHGRLLAIRFKPDRAGDEARRLLQIATTAAALGAIAGLIVLTLNVRSLLRAREANTMIVNEDDPRGDSHYLLQTFETSIRSMKSQQSELQRLRDQEKARADDLAAVTRTLVRSLASGFIAIDPEGAVLDMNEQAREILALPEQPLPNESFARAFGESTFSRILQDAIRNQRTLQREEIADDRSGRLIGLTTVPLLDEAGRYFGMLALFVDLSPVRKLEERVRAMQSLADLGEMSAGIAHEFRNSLSTIVGYLRLARRANPPREVDERLSRAETEAQLLHAAVESLLTFARPLPLQLQRVNVMDIIRGVVEQRSSVNAAIRVDIDGPSITIDGDAALLRRALENILRNAEESIQEKAGEGRIEIRSEVTGEVSRITICDNGVGLDSTDAARLLLPFQSTKPNGFGVGLALTNKIILLHGGLIALTGSPGVGATVTLDFPVVSNPRVD